MKLKFQKGITLVEILLVIGIVFILSTILLTSFTNLRSNQAIMKNTETVVAVLRQARNQTLSSKNSSVYGVHFATSTITLFTGGTYSSLNSTNQDFIFPSSDSILTTTLNGNGKDVVFNRLSGETSQNGTIVISSPRVSLTKTVTIYKTGLVESQ
jgi:type II secretory pathway pseudopilin PulG